MKKTISFFTFLSLIILGNGYSQSMPESATIKSKELKPSGKELHGIVIDSAGHSPLPYATIFILHTDNGVISNENGDFSIDITGLEKTDTICFQYIGYQKAYYQIGSLDTFAIIYLKEAIYDLSEMLVFGNAPDAKTIVKQIVKNKDANYQKTTCERQTFIRQRDIVDFDRLHLIYKNSTIPELDERALKLLEESIPRHTTSYTDFLGNIYLTKNEEDSSGLKMEPIRSVALKEKEYDDLKQFEEIFENLLKTTGENEYWKFKSGVLSEKIDKSEIESDSDNDTIDDNKRTLKYFASNIKSRLKYSLLEDKDQWEFLYETGKYEYTLDGGTRFNGEDVYIINFKPANSGLYTGRLYVSIETYALIRADYEYAPGKTGTDIHLLGVGYTETAFSASIYFEKKGDNYLLKYFSVKTAANATVNRSIELSKKKKRTLFDKELMDFDLELDLSLTSENLVEYYTLDDKEITEAQFSGFKQPEYYEVIYVDQFDDNLWSGYSIIEPTRQMKEYKKQDAGH
jgi:hypothetical protein